MADLAADEIDTKVDPESAGFAIWLERNLDIVKHILQNGVDGTFTTTDGKTVTVTKGIITRIV